MNFRGGCCIAKYVGGGGGVYDMSKVDRIMLRYRPIAPRPDSGGSCSPPVNSVSPKSRRGKRKISKEKSSSGGGSVTSNDNSKRCNRPRHEEFKNRSEVVTLSLLPETPERNERPSVLAPRAESGAASLWLSFGDDMRHQTAKKKSDLKSELAIAKTETVVSSWLTVECVTKGEYELGCTDEERRMNLERDTCPCFISDASGRVIWTNGLSHVKLGCSTRVMIRNCVP